MKRDTALTEKELRELDEWIAEHVMGWKRGVLYGNGNGEWMLNGKVHTTWQQTPEYSSTPAALEVLKKCADKSGSRISINRHINGLYQVFRTDEHIIQAKTLQLAICLFSKALFTVAARPQMALMDSFVLC